MDLGQAAWRSCRVRAGGDWLHDEIKHWRLAGVDVVVSALTEEEGQAFDLARQSELVRAEGMDVVLFPIADRGMPTSLEAMAGLARKLEADLTHGKNVAVHCRQGIGRSSLIAACTLVLGGIDAKEAFERIERSRGCPVPDTLEQREWVLRFANSQRPVAKI